MPPMPNNFVIPRKAKAPLERGFFFRWRRSGDFCNVGGLRSFLALNNFELDLIALG